MFSEFVGLTQEVASLIESKRERVAETKNDILKRMFLDARSLAEDVQIKSLDLGQGIQLPAGEKLYLYLSKPNSVNQQPDGIAEVRDDGLYLDGERVQPSHRSLIHPAMQIIQERVGHKNQLGKLVSLSAYRQWHVVRDGKLVPIDELKDPQKRRRRAAKASKVDVEALLAELGIR